MFSRIGQIHWKNIYTIWNESLYHVFFKYSLSYTEKHQDISGFATSENKKDTCYTPEN